MSTKIKQIAPASPRLKARLAGFFWLIVFAAGSLALYLGDGAAASVANIVASSCYAIATLLIYDLLKPVNRNISLLAAIFSLIGCTISLLGLTRYIGLRDIVFFGLHCLGVGYLIFRSTFLPRILGVLMMFAGLGWLTFLWMALADYLSPYNLLPGMIGEGLLILWLLIFGVNAEQWQEQAKVHLEKSTMRS